MVLPSVPKLNVESDFLNLTKHMIKKVFRCITGTMEIGELEVFSLQNTEDRWANQFWNKYSQEKHCDNKKKCCNVKAHLLEESHHTT